MNTPDSYPDRLEARHEDGLAKTEATSGKAETGLSPEAEDEQPEAELEQAEAEQPEAQL